MGRPGFDVDTSDVDSRGYDMLDLGDRRKIRRALISMLYWDLTMLKMFKQFKTARGSIEQWNETLVGESPKETYQYLSER